MAHWTDPLKTLTRDRDEAEANAAFVKVLSYVPETRGCQRGTATVKFFDCLTVKGLRLMHSDKGPWLAMPSRKNAAGDFEDVAYLTTPEMREVVLGLVQQAAKAAAPALVGARR